MIFNEIDANYRPSSLTAYERFEALIPILSEASESYMRLYSEKESEQRDQEIRSRLDSLFDRVANKSSMSREEAKRAFIGYTLKGFAGLMTPTPIDAKKCVLDARGTWELSSRYTGGGSTTHARADNRQTRARSKIYYEVTGPTEAKELVTMWNDENHYHRDEALAKHSLGQDATFFIVAFSRSKFRQVDDFTVEYTNFSEVCGNHAPYMRPAKGDGRVLLMNIDGELTFASVPDGHAILEDGTKRPVLGTYLLLNSRITPTWRSFTMSGLPPMNGDSRTMDVTDHYVKVSDQQPLIGGWEPIEAYYARLRDVPTHSARMAARAGETGHVHGFYSANRDALKHYDLV